MKEWEKEGKKDWRQNRLTREQEKARAEYFENREISIYKNKLTT